MIRSLPLDLLRMILEEVDDDQSLARCCLASKVMLSTSRPLLYRHIEVLILSSEDEGSDDDGPAIAFIIHQILGKSNALLQTLQRYPRLRDYVQHVKYVCTSSWDDGDFEWIDEPMDIFKQVLALVPTPKTLTLVDPEDLNAVDEIVQEIKGKRDPSPEVHLELLESSFVGLFDMKPLNGSHASLTLGQGWSTPVEGLEGIMATVPSFKLICSVDAGGFSLSKFSKVEHLELFAEAPPAPRRWAKPDLTVRPLEYLRNSLHELSRLKSVVISGYPSPILDQFVSPHELIPFLPSSVTVLQIKVDIGVDKLVGIVKSLPLSTGLKTLGIRFEGGDLTELIEECGKTGIKLALV